MYVCIWRILLYSSVPNLFLDVVSTEILCSHEVLFYKESTITSNAGPRLSSASGAQLSRIFWISLFRSCNFPCTLQNYCFKPACCWNRIFKINPQKIFVCVFNVVLLEAHIQLYRCSFQIRQEISLTPIITFYCFPPIWKFLS